MEDGRDVREELTPEHHETAQAATPAAADAPVELRLARAEDADSVARCFYGSYGDSYDHAWVYKPEALRRRWSERAMVSVVGLTPDGEIVGHLAANFARSDSKVAEAGQAVVSPRFRGHHLFESMKKWLAAWAGRDGLYGLFSEATTAHPYSQRGNLALGAHEMGFLFGYIPGQVDYKQITEGSAPQRKTAALMYLRTNREPERVVHLPPRYRDIGLRIYGNAGFDRSAGAGEGASSAAVSLVRVHSESEIDAVLLNCETVGADLDAAIGDHVEKLKEAGVARIYVDLPLADSNVHGADLSRHGFAFCCILPEARDDGDVLRLQYLSGVDLHIGEVATSSDFGRALLAEITADYQKEETNQHERI